ncbi:MAG: nitroreductase [Succinivibrio sp.]
MTEILDVIRTRRSIRRFKTDAVPRELIEKVIEAGTYAATGRNSQSPVIIAVTNRELRDRISSLNAKIYGKPDFDTFYGAPVILIVAASKAANTYVYDGSLVLGNMMLEAHHQGLGSCWIHRCRESMSDPLYKEIFERLGIQGEYEGIGHLALGYTDGEYPKTLPRKENYSYFIE